MVSECGRAPFGARIVIRHILFWLSIGARQFHTKSTGCLKILRRQLENWNYCPGCVVLRDRENIFGAGSRSVGNETPPFFGYRQTRTYASEKIGTVPTQTLQPEHFFKVRFDHPSSSKARIVVETKGGPVDIYVVSDDDFPNFLGSHGVYTAKYPKQTDFETVLSLGSYSWKPWHLVFENPSSDKTIKVSYQVYP